MKIENENFSYNYYKLNELIKKGNYELTEEEKKEIINKR